MPNAVLLFALLLAPGFAQPQLPASPDQAIVVGRLSDLQLTLNPGMVTASARLTITRVVKGALSPGSVLPISWEFRCPPQLTAEMLTKSAPLFGLVRLQPTGKGQYQPVPADLRSPTLLGGIVLALPDDPVPALFAQPPDAPPDLRLAAELTSALSLILQKTGEPASSTGGRRDASGEWGYSLSGDQARFQQVSMSLLSLDANSTAPHFRQLLHSPSPNLRAIGVAALLRTADEEAFQILERESSQLAKTLAAYHFSSSIRTLDLQKHPKLTAPLGRLALQETELPNFEFAAISALGRAPTPEALPFLAAFLESPYNATRAYTVTSLCNFARNFRENPQSGPRLWNPDMQQYCPSTFPLRRPADEPTYTNFWRQWYTQDAAAFRRDHHLSGPALPARFRDTSITDTPEPEVSMEARFNAWIHTVLTTEQRRLTNPSPNQPALFFASRMSPEEETLVLAKVHQLDAELKRMKQEVMGPSGQPATMPPQVVIEQAEKGRRELLRGGLDDLKRELSPRAWQVVEEAMLGMAISIHPPGAIGPWD